MTGALCTGADCDAASDWYSSMFATPPAATARTTSTFVGPMAVRSSGSCVGVTGGVKESDDVAVAVSDADGDDERVTDDVMDELGVTLADPDAVAPADSEHDGDADWLGVFDGVVVALAVLLGDDVGVCVVVLVDDGVGVGVCDALTGTTSTCMKPEPVGAVASSVYPEPAVALASCVVS